MRLKAEAWLELMRQYYDKDTSSFPKSFVAPSHAFYYNPGDDQDLGALLHSFGLKYANSAVQVSTSIADGGAIDHGVLLINRAYGSNYNWEGKTPWEGDWNDFQTIRLSK